MSAEAIFARASPAGPAARALVRVSGADAFALSARALGVSLERRRGTVHLDWRLRGARVPVLAIGMPGPKSYTGEDVVELHLIGSEPLVVALEGALAGSGLRQAEPGEFTRRAFENGRIALDRALGVAALVAARGEDQRRAATDLLRGGLEQAARAAGDLLEALCALIEASLDFDEADTGHVPTQQFVALLDELEPELAELEARVGAKLAGDEPRTVLVGAPNAGKSTLWNRLVKGGRAIESDVRGTTRDALEGVWELAPGGLRVRLIDLPGFEDSFPSGGALPGSPAAQRAEELARERLAGAELILEVRPLDGTGGPRIDWEKWLPPGVQRLCVRTKSDLGGEASEGPGLVVSARTGEGLLELADRVARTLEQSASGGLSVELSQRYSASLSEVRGRIGQARAGLDGSVPLDLVATELRAALEALAELAGRRLPEDLLDRIFAQFCLGK